MKYKMIWPEVITDPDFEYGPNTKESRAGACADGLNAWTCCVMERSPENFGLGLVKIMNYLEMKNAPTGDNLMEYAKRFRSPLAVLGW